VSDVRVAVVGIDGSGKTTLLRRLAERDGFAVVHAIRAHDDPHSPVAALSRSLAGASAAADVVGRIQLKVAVLSLQLCLYGPVERHAARGARVLLADRHPLVDPLVYLPLFGQLARDDAHGGDVEAWWRRQEPRGAHEVRDWLVTRTGHADPWALGEEMLELGTRPLEEMLDRLGRRFGVLPPDGVLLLDLPVTEALSRTRERGRAGELHETRTFLSMTRQRYQAVLDWLGEARPGVARQRVDCSGLGVDELADLVRDSVGALRA
jgi:thymidylate kinase